MSEGRGAQGLGCTPGFRGRRPPFPRAPILPLFKGELSTLQKSGTFYFALTQKYKKPRFGSGAFWVLQKSYWRLAPPLFTGRGWKVRSSNPSHDLVFREADI
jgi:hypothetical protein